MSDQTAHGGKPSRLAQLEEMSVPLIVGVIAALIWANVRPHSYHHFVHAPLFGIKALGNAHFLINDIFMALFFGIAAKEITEACLPGGSLNPPRKAVNPLLGTIGGVVGPAGVYLAFVAITGDKSIASGWGIPTATDIALAWLVARVAFGKDHPAVSFLLLLAVADDGIGLAIIAIFYPNPLHPVQPAFLGLVAFAVAIAWTLKRQGVKSYWLYLIFAGTASWCGLFFAHLHPALALVPVVPLMPHANKDEGLFAEMSSGKTYTDTLNRFEHAFKRPVDLGLLAFGLANAGVRMSTMGNATYGVLLALVAGKTVGISGMSLLGQRLGFPLPEGMNVRTLVLAAMTAALGLTVALFVAGVAFTDPGLQGAAKMGALASAGVAPAVLVLARMLDVKEHQVAPAVARQRRVTDGF